MDIPALKREIEVVQNEMAPLTREIARLKSELRKAESLEFIRVNGITKDKVQRSNGEGVPWLGHIYNFGGWLEHNSDKPWCEWNGSIYQSSEIIAGRMPEKAPGLYDDLPD